jgi:hypothetical protein
VGEQRLEALVLLPHLAHLRLGRFQLLILHTHANENTLDEFTRADDLNHPASIQLLQLTLILCS